MGSVQHGEEVALGDLTEAPMEGPEDNGARLFPVLCGGRISESHTEQKEVFSL